MRSAHALPRRRTTLSAALAVVLAAAALTVAGSGGSAQALDNGLAAAPQLGWNDWNSFGCGVSDSLVRASADALVSSGMAAAGYRYVNIDDCWSAKARDSGGNLVPDPVKFPYGMTALADYVHAKGLKLGIYSSAGLTTCAGYPASLNNEAKDARRWASWGIDYLKYDNCGDTQGKSGQERYTAMRDALAASGRQIFFAICNWGNDDVKTWGPTTGNSWRTGGDITNSWSSVLSTLDNQQWWTASSRPGGWNDPDMLEVGNGLTDTEARSHFGLWAMLNAPLIAGNDLRTMSAATRTTLTNTEVIAVDQDWGGSQGTRVSSTGGLEVWKKRMANGAVAVALFNRGASTATVSTTTSAVGLAPAASYSVRDLWAHTTTTSGSTISASVSSHGIAMVVVTAGSGTPVTTAPTPAPVVGTVTALRGTASGRCLDVLGQATANLSPVGIWDCNGQTNQQWVLGADGSVRGVQSHRCLDVTGQATAAGSPVELWDCNGQGNQRWTLATDGTLRGQQSGRCLSVVGAATADRSLVTLADCTGRAGQVWTR